MYILFYRIIRKVKRTNPWFEKKRRKKRKRWEGDFTSTLYLSPTLPSFFPLNMSSFGLTFWSSYLFDTRQIFRRASSVVRDGIIYLDRNNFQRDFGNFSSMFFKVRKVYYFAWLLRIDNPNSYVWYCDRHFRLLSFGKEK